MGRNKYTTFFLVILVLIIFSALIFTIYYLFLGGEHSLDFLKKNTETKTEGIFVSPLSSKRAYTVDVNGDEYTARIYKDGTMGLMIYKEGEVGRKIQNKVYLTGSIDKININSVDYVYEVKAGTNSEIVFLVVKKDGTIYKINNELLYSTGTITFDKIPSITKIVRIYQTGVIVNDPKHSNSNNVIAVDINGNEYIITDLITTKVKTQLK